MGYKCKVKEKEAQPVLSVRTKSAATDLPQVLGKNYGAIAQYLGELGENPGGPPFVAFYNLDMQNLDIEIGFPVIKNLPDKDEIKSREIPSGKFASCLYIGPYNEIEPAYNELNRWLGEKGYEATGVAYEVYLDDPSQTPPEDLRTEILFPLK